MLELVETRNEPDIDEHFFRGIKQNGGQSINCLTTSSAPASFTAKSFCGLSDQCSQPRLKMDGLKMDGTNYFHQHPRR
jgi:hypothetical protein